MAPAPPVRLDTMKLNGNIPAAMYTQKSDMGEALTSVKTT